MGGHDRQRARQKIHLGGGRYVTRAEAEAANKQERRLEAERARGRNSYENVSEADRKQRKVDQLRKRGWLTFNELESSLAPALDIEKDPENGTWLRQVVLSDLAQLGVSYTIVGGGLLYRLPPKRKRAELVARLKRWHAIELLRSSE